MKKIPKPIKIPTCAACWDKGYATVMQNFHQASDDFNPGKHAAVNRTFERRNYCPCKKGQKLQKVEKDTIKK